jgi:hypothetical protein
VAAKKRAGKTAKQATPEEMRHAFFEAKKAARRVGCDDPESIANTATFDAVRTWDGRAKLSTLAYTIATRLALRESKKRRRAIEADAGHQDLLGEHHEPRPIGRPPKPTMHTRQELIDELTRRWARVTAGRPLPRKPPASAELERQRRAINAIADAWEELIAAHRAPDGWMTAGDGIVHHAISKVAMWMFAFTQWRDGNVATKRRLLDVHVKPKPATPTMNALASLIWWGVDELSEAKLRKGVKPGDLLRAEIRALSTHQAETKTAKPGNKKPR